MDSCGESFFFYGLFFYPEFLVLVPSTTNPVQQLIFLLSISTDGKPIILLLSSSPWSGDFLGLLDVTQVRLLSTNICWSSLWPHSFLTVILWRLATVNSNTRIVVILFLSSQWDTTWQNEWLILSRIISVGYQYPFIAITPRSTLTLLGSHLWVK